MSESTWSPSSVETQRRPFRRSRTVRSAALSAVSTVVVLGVLGWLVPHSAGWPRVQETFFSWDMAVESFPAVLEGLWLNIRLMVVCGLSILVLGLTLAIMRTLRGPIFVPLRLLATVYVDLFRGLPLLLLLLLLGRKRFGDNVVLLLDEVTSALDPELVGEVLDLLGEPRTRQFLSRLVS